MAASPADCGLADCEAGRPRFQTTTTRRLVSPNISDLYNSSWNIAEKILISQLTAISGSRPDGDGPPPLLRLRESAQQLENVLPTIASGTPTIDQTPPDDPIHRLNQPFTTEAGPGIPLENLPLFPWYLSFQLRTSRVFASLAGSTVAAESLETLTQLQRWSMERMLQYWWSLDLLVSAGRLPARVLEPASEHAEATPAGMLQSTAIRMWISGLTSILFALPLPWIRLNLAAIR